MGGWSIFKVWNVLFGQIPQLVSRLEIGKDLAFDKRVEQLLISACEESN